MSNGSANHKSHSHSTDIVPVHRRDWTLIRHFYRLVSFGGQFRNDRIQHIQLPLYGIVACAMCFIIAFDSLHFLFIPFNRFHFYTQLIAFGLHLSGSTLGSSIDLIRGEQFYVCLFGFLIFNFFFLSILPFHLLWSIVLFFTCCT